MRSFLILATWYILSFASVSASAQTASLSFIIIVNSANEITSVSRAELSDVFLKRLVKWSSGGTRIAPVDLPRRSPVRNEFSRAVHTRSSAAVGAYWQQQIFSGKDTPPPERRNDAEVVTFVRENPGAIGYVAPGTPLGVSVKVITVRWS